MLLNEVGMLLSGYRSDVLAFFDSYAVEVWRGGRLVLRQPVRYCEHADQPWPDRDSKIDRAVKLKLIRWSPPDNDWSNQPPYTRWPFYVNDRLHAFFKVSDQWRTFTFDSGKTYEERDFQEVA